MTQSQTSRRVEILKPTKVLEQSLQSKKRIVVNQGGTSSGKTYGVLLALIIIATKTKSLISIVSETMPHLKRGAMRDFFNILQSWQVYKSAMHNKTDHIYRINESIIEFFSAESDDRLRGGRRDYLFINECNNITFDAFGELEIRTKNKIFLDFNPVQAFWIHDKILPHYDCTFIKSTYHDNPYLSDNIKLSIEAKQNIPGYGELVAGVRPGRGGNA